MRGERPMAILTYEDVKDKASTLRAMTSLDRDEFEALAVTFRPVQLKLANSSLAHA